MIATTETTRLYAEGNRAAYEAAGIMNDEWQTVADKDVCSICEGLGGRKRVEDERTETPPAHVLCRCAILPVTGGRTITEEGGAVEEE